MSLLKRLAVLVMFFIVVTGCYLGSQRFVLNYRTLSDVNLMIPGEDRIPFAPAFLLVYASIYFLPVFIFLSLKRKGRILKTFTSFIIAVIVHLFFFIALPIPYQMRPVVSWSSGVFSELFYVLYSIDRPINTFPSMHVSFAFICYFIVKRYFPTHARATFLLAVAVAVSTLLVKQHYIMDGVSGFLLAGGINQFYIKKTYT